MFHLDNTLTMLKHSNISIESTFQNNLLHKIAVVGCADPDQSGVKLVRRTDEKATVKCPNSDLSWSLTCNKTSGVWTGSNHKCHESKLSHKNNIFVVYAGPISEW